MNKSPIHEPGPALALAIAAAVLAHKANANAARTLGVPVAVIGLLIAGALAVGGLRSG
jgi:hypothetical protein